MSFGPQLAPECHCLVYFTFSFFKLQAEAHRTHMLGWVPHAEKSHCCPLFRFSKNRLSWIPSTTDSACLFILKVYHEVQYFFLFFLYFFFCIFLFLWNWAEVVSSWLLSSCVCCTTLFSTKAVLVRKTQCELLLFSHYGVEEQNTEVFYLQLNRTIDTSVQKWLK